MGQIGQEEDGNDTVNATAIITGEFFKEQMSTVSRILYLNVGNFLEVEKIVRIWNCYRGIVIIWLHLCVILYSGLFGK